MERIKINIRDKSRYFSLVWVRDGFVILIMVKISGGYGGDVICCSMWVVGNIKCISYSFFF